MSFKLCLVAVVLALEFSLYVTQEAPKSQVLRVKLFDDLSKSDDSENSTPYNLNQQPQKSPMERQGRILGILGNWGYGYPGFGEGAYGKLLCGRKNRLHSRNKICLIHNKHKHEHEDDDGSSSNRREPSYSLNDGEFSLN